MISNREFIKTQAFELSWAVFRCTELFTQSKLRSEVEAAAVELIADQATLNDAMENEFPRIEKLTSLVRLAESVGQIASVNANVLYRELDNLAKAIRLEVVDRREKKNITASLERMFTNSAYTQNLAITSGHPEPAEGSAADSSTPQSTAPLGMTKKETQDNSASQFGSIESLLSAAAKSSQPISAPVIPARSAGLEKAPAGIQSAPNSATETLNAFLQKSPSTDIPSLPRDLQSESGKADSSIAAPSAASLGMTRTALVRQPQVATAGSWQNVILQKVKDLGQTTTKELTASFPEISERTIRFYLQKLVDNGSIDRVGSTGPGAAYKAK